VKFQSALSIYILFWVMSFFVVIPIGVRTDEEAGAEKHPGQADSAPHGFSLARAALRATLLSGLLFALFWLNYIYGWITADTLDWAAPPKR
jgi:predicted secreted protein